MWQGRGEAGSGRGVNSYGAAGRRLGMPGTVWGKIDLPSRKSFDQDDTALWSLMATMSLRKSILRWGVLGRWAHAAGRAPAPEKRRAHRVAAAMPVLVYGHSTQAPFAEPATTANVSKTGGLVALGTKVMRFQKLIVTNIQTNEDAICRVVRLVRSFDGRTMAAVEFVQPAPRFWAIEFAGESGAEQGGLKS
jgi:hypothetical protein